MPGSGSSAEIGDTRVYENTNAYPRAWVVHDVHVVGGEDDAFAFLEAHARRRDGAFIVDAFDPRREAVVEHAGRAADATLRVLQDGRDGCTGETATARASSATPRRSVTLRVEAACAGLLVLPDTYFPGWRATVNGRDRTIYPTDGAFRGVTVPKGTSRVEFRYEPRAFPIGLLSQWPGSQAFLAIASVVLVAHAGAGVRAAARR